MIRVAIVEDDVRVRESLAVLINGTDEFSCTGTYDSAELALKQIPGDWPDVILMDINLPGMSGIELVARLKKLHPALQVIMLTVYMDNEKIFKSLKAGASGYLIKKTPPARILEALHDVCQGGSPMSNSIARKVVQYFQQTPAENETDQLSQREQEVLAYLAKGYQSKEIATALTISLPTVSTHIRNIYEKLHVRSRAEAVVKFLGHFTSI